MASIVVIKHAIQNVRRRRREFSFKRLINTHLCVRARIMLYGPQVVQVPMYIVYTQVHIIILRTTFTIIRTHIDYH